MLKDDQVKAVKAAIDAWYVEFQKKGEKQVLIEATEQGDDNSPAQAERLVEKYPDAALAAIARGLKAATRDWTRAALVQVAGSVPGGAPVDSGLGRHIQQPGR